LRKVLRAQGEWTSRSQLGEKKRSSRRGAWRSKKVVNRKGGTGGRKKKRGEGLSSNLRGGGKMVNPGRSKAHPMEIR